MKILGFQLKYNEYSDAFKEYIIMNKTVEKQFEKTFELIEEHNPDLIIYPELSYTQIYDEYFYKKSKDKIIVFGSVYDKDNLNKTVVYKDGIKKLIPKMYASPTEPMARKLSWIDPNEFIEKHLEEHTYKFKNFTIYILNCMEYYHTAYFIARNPNLNKKAVIVSPCSNNNSGLFIDESRAIHNHNENIYSIVINCIDKEKNIEYSDGTSYIYGPVQKQNRKWLNDLNVPSDNHNCSILRADKKARYVYMEISDSQISHFGRSDMYQNSPNIIYDDLKPKVLTK